jgi:hypothetical protein
VRGMCEHVTCACVCRFVLACADGCARLSVGAHAGATLDWVHEKLASSGERESNGQEHGQSSPVHDYSAVYCTKPGAVGVVQAKDVEQAQPEEWGRVGPVRVHGC